ncbi:hypothetical protein DWG18_01155 [Lysobacter sp. TY2-98]|nr:hypothetical protein DWG18_01155 [Lysobacter sp. TY2-98]
MSDIELHRSCGVARCGRPLVDVALEVGFSDHSHFTKVLAAAFGNTPARLAALGESVSGRIDYVRFWPEADISRLRAGPRTTAMQTPTACSLSAPVRTRVASRRGYPPQSSK